MSLDNPNNPPWIEPDIPTITVYMNQEYTRPMRQHANDVDPDDVLSWSAVIPDNDIIRELQFKDDHDMTLVINPVEDAVGEVIVTFVLMDSYGWQDAQDVRIVVLQHSIGGAK